VNLPNRICLLALAVSLVAVCVHAGEPVPPVRPKLPDRPAFVEGPEPRIKLAKDKVAGTLAAITNQSLSVEKRVSAIAVAAAARLQKAVGALGRVLARNDNVVVQVAAVWALGEIRDPAAIPALLRAHGKAAGPNPRLRYEKKVAFPNLGKEMSLIDLIENGIGQLGEMVLSKYIKILKAPGGDYQTQDKRTVNRQRSALAVIVCVGDRDFRAVKTLEDLLKSPDGAYPADFRETAALGLARVLHARTKEFGVVMARDKLADRLTKALTDHIVTIPPSLGREYIASALNLSNPVYAVTLLTIHFADGSGKKIRQRTIEVLGMLRSREATEALVWALEKETDVDLRTRAAKGLGLSGKSKIAIAALKKAATDKSPKVQLAACAALARISGKEAVPFIAGKVSAKDVATRIGAARALGVSRDPSAVPHLLIAAKDENVQVRATAIAALAAIPTRESLAALVRATKDIAREVRYTAMRVLVKLHGAPVYAALIGLVSDPDRRIRAAATNALHLAKAHHVTELKTALIRVIKDRKSRASADACDFADFPKDAQIVEALQKAKADPRPGVRASALKMLREMGLK
jgi:HEAT repeat protein